MKYAYMLFFAFAMTTIFCFTQSLLGSSDAHNRPLFFLFGVGIGLAAGILGALVGEA